MTTMLSKKTIEEFEKKYTEEMHAQLLKMKATIDRATTLDIKTLICSMDHDNPDVLFAVPLYKVLDKLPMKDNLIIKRYGVFYDIHTVKYGTNSAIAFVEYVPE